MVVILSVVAVAGFKLLPVIKEKVELNNRFVLISSETVMDNSIERYEIFEYDSYGCIISDILRAGDYEYICSNFKYDDFGNVISCTENSKSLIDNTYGGKTKYTYTYDSNGNRRTMKCENSKEGLNFDCIYKYDDYGNVIEQIENDGCTKTTYKMNLKYENGKCIQNEETVEDSDGFVTYWLLLYTYDESGNKIREEHYNYIDSSEELIIPLA